MYCDGSGGDTPTSQTVDASDGAGRRGGTGGLLGGGGRGSTGGGQQEADEEERAPAPKPRPTQSSGQQSGEERESGRTTSNGLGSWWPFGNRGNAEKRVKFSHVSQDLGLREDLHKTFLHGE